MGSSKEALLKQFADWAEGSGRPALVKALQDTNRSTQAQAQRRIDTHVENMRKGDIMGLTALLAWAQEVPPESRPFTAAQLLSLNVG